MSFRGPRICQYPLESGKLKQLTNDVKAKIWNLHGTEEREAYVQGHVRRCLKAFTQDVWPRFGPLALTRVVASITSEKLITSEKPAEASTVEEGAGEPEVHLPGILEAIQQMSDEATIWEGCCVYQILTFRNIIFIIHICSFYFHDNKKFMPSVVCYESVVRI